PGMRRSVRPEHWADGAVGTGGARLGSGCINAGSGRGMRMEMREILTGLEEARAQLDAVRSAMADPLKRWSSEPQRRELVPEVVAALSAFMGTEAVYLRLLEQAVLELGEKVLKFGEERETTAREEPIKAGPKGASPGPAP